MVGGAVGGGGAVVGGTVVVGVDVVPGWALPGTTVPASAVSSGEPAQPTATTSRARATSSAAARWGAARQAGGGVRSTTRPGWHGAVRAAATPRGGRGDGSTRAGAAPGGRRYSWTSSIRVPKEVFGCTKATVVPRLPGRGAWSMTLPPLALIDSSASPQSATR